MKRFWTAATVAAAPAGFAVKLDGRPLKTPKQAALILPKAALAEAIASEWNAVEGEVQPAAMPLTGLASAAIDLVAKDPATFATDLARFAHSDGLCYRAEGPAALVARQAALWEPIVKSVEARHGLLFRRTTGIVPVQQPAGTLAAVQRLLTGLDPFRLAALQPLVTISGSAIVGLAMLAGLIETGAAFAASELDADYQVEQWGDDPTLQLARENRQRMFCAAAAFLDLVGTLP